MIKRLLLAAVLAAAPVAASATPPLPVDQPPPPPLTHPPALGRVGPPPGDLLGQAWEQEEVSGWRGLWLRRGMTRIFDAYWQHQGGERVRAVLEMHPTRNGVVVIRRHPGGQYCRYDGTFQHDVRWINGRYTCTWQRTPMAWSARIVHLDEATPQVLRQGRRR